MSSEWLEVTLGEFVRLQRGHDLTASEQEPGNVPIMGSAGQNGTHSKALANGPGVVVGRSGASAGRVHFSEVDYWPHNTCLYVTDFLGNSPRFAYYLLQTIDLASYNSGSAQASLNRNFLYSIKLDIPSRHIQDRIAEFLDSLDHRINLLRETNFTLEAIAQALFKSWFVDFDPVRAKLGGRVPEGMDEATAALFPDGFEGAKLSAVPRGWGVGTLADMSVLNPESWSTKKHPDIVAYIDLANAKDNEISEVMDYEFDEAPSRARRVLRSGDTIIGTVRPGNRSFAYIHAPPGNLTGSTGFAVLRPSAIETTEFVYLAATQDSSIEHLTHVADGGAYPAIRPDVVSALRCVIPVPEVLEAFHGVTAPLLENVCENQRRARTLASLRDTLLPRLISGQLRLPDVEN